MVKLSEMIKKASLIILYFFCTQVVAQEPVDNSILKIERKISKIKNVREKIDCYNELSQYYLDVDSLKSKEYLEKAFYLSKKNNYNYGLSFYYEFLAANHFDTYQYVTCIKYSLLAEKYALFDNDFEVLLNVKYRKASALFALKLYDSLISDCGFFLENNKIKGFATERGKLYQIMGYAYIEKRSPLALKYLHQSILLLKTEPNNKFLITVYDGLAKYHLIDSKIDSAIFYYNLELRHTSFSSLGEVDKIDVASKLYVLNTLRGNSKEAALTNEVEISGTHKIKDQIFDLQKKIIQVKFLDAESKKQIAVKSGLIVGVIFMCILLGISLYFYFKTKKKKLQLIKLNAQLSQSLKVNAILLQEVDHRVRNNFQVILSLLYLQSDTMSEASAHEFFKKIISRVETISQINQHFHLENDFSVLNMADYLNWLIVNVIENFNIHKKRIHFKKLKIEVELQIDQLVPIGLIINELLINSIKHAFVGRDTGSIILDFKKSAEELVIIYEDDGVGLAELKPTNHQLGMSIIQSLIEQLDGYLTIDSTDGFKAMIHLPL